MTQHSSLAPEALDQLFRQARTHNDWTGQAVGADTLKALYELWKWGPTSANCSPARVIFVQSAQAKSKLLECVSPGNVDKTKAAPVCAIIGMDMAFYEKLPTLFPHADARSWFAGQDALIHSTAFRNSTLQGAYLMMAARSLGLDCGPMSGFDAAKIEANFFANASVKVNFLCNLGYGNPAKLFDRSPRLAFDDACQVI